MTRTPKIGRNDCCPCGSGKKHKACCAAKVQNPWTGRVMVALLVALLAGGIAAGLSSRGGHASSPGAVPGKVWSPEHGHFH